MTAQHAGNAQCKVYSIVEETENARVLCFAPDGTPTGNVFWALVRSLAARTIVARSLGAPSAVRAQFWGRCRL